MNQEPPGTLQPGEPHPSAHIAFHYVKSLSWDRQCILMESFSSCAIDSSNRYAVVCAETMRRMMAGESVSDRYILGLAWAIRWMEEPKTDKQ